MNNSKWYAPYVASWGNEEPSQFAEAFARTIPIEAGQTRLLDIGCGSGVIGIFSLLQKKARCVAFSDIASEWIDVARKNVDIKIREGAIDPSQVRFLDAMDLTRIPYEEVARYDLVAFNPPQLPYALIDDSVKEKIDSDPIERAFRRGGESGLDIARMFLNWYAALPKPKPAASILLSSFLGRNSIASTISAAGLRLDGEPVETTATLRPMFWERAESLSTIPAEVEDRAIRKVGAVWHKTLLTYRLVDR